MLFWILAILMVAAAVVCVLVPLSRQQINVQRGSEAQVYEAQLREFGSDSEEGANNNTLEERAEIGRRLLAVQNRDENEPDAGNSNRPAVIGASIVALFFIPVFTVFVYSVLGAPGFEATRRVAEQLPIEQQSVGQLVATAEQQLKKNPDDLRGWTVLAAVYGRTGQFVKRAQALSNMVRLSGPTTELLAELAEARTLANDGIVTEETVTMLQGALASGQWNIKAKAYLVLANEQEGNLKDALKEWRELLVRAKGHERWESRIAQRIEALESQVADTLGPGPSQQQVNDASKMSADDRASMIANMVAGLSQRLEDQPDDIDGWLRLIRSFHVLGEAEKLLAAWRKSMTVFSGREIETARLMAMIAELGYTTDKDGNLQGGVFQ